MKTWVLWAWALSSALTLRAQLGYIEEGYATYYSDKFHGRRTASGAKYDKDELTCAHKQLPFGTRVRVVNLENKKEVVVVVTDRGPYAPGRIVDLSKAAARKVGLLQAGVHKVRLEVVGVPRDGDALLASSDKAKPQIHESPKPASAPTTKPVAASKVEPPKPAPVVKSEAPTAKPAKSASASDARPSALTHLPASMLKAPGIYHISGKKAKPKGWGIQLGAFQALENVESLCRQIMDAGYQNIHIIVAPLPKPAGNAPSPTGFVYRVILGVYPEENVPKNLEEIERKGLVGGFKYKFM